MISLFIVILLLTGIAFLVSIPLNVFLTSLLVSRLYSTHSLHDETYSLAESFDLMGTLCFFLLGFGWGTVVPVHRHYLRHRGIGYLLLAYSMQALVSLAIALGAIVPSVILTGRGCVYTALNMFFVNSLYQAAPESTWQAFQRGAVHFSSCSSYAITATLFLMGIVYVQISMVCISLVRNAFQALLQPFEERIMMSEYSWFFMIVLPLLFCIFFYKFFFALAIGCMVFFIEVIHTLIYGN